MTFLQYCARFLSMQAQAPLLSLLNLPAHRIPSSINQLNDNIGTGETQCGPEVEPPRVSILLSEYILAIFSCDPSWTWGKLLDTHRSWRKHLCRNLPYQFQGDDIHRLRAFGTENMVVWVDCTKAKTLTHALNILLQGAGLHCKVMHGYNPFTT